MLKKVIVFAFFFLVGFYHQFVFASQPISKACMHAVDLAVKGTWEQSYQTLPVQTCPLTAEVIQCLDLKDDYRHHTFQEYQQFISRHPDWPWSYMLRKRAETK